MSGVFREATKVFELISDDDDDDDDTKMRKISTESNLCSNIWQLLWTTSFEKLGGTSKASEPFKMNESLKNKISNHLN